MSQASKVNIATLDTSIQEGASAAWDLHLRGIAVIFYWVIDKADYFWVTTEINILSRKSFGHCIAEPTMLGGASSYNY